MKVKAQINQPEKLDVTLEITMPLSEWIELSEQLVGAYPSWKLTTAINDVVYKAKDIFVAGEDINI